MRQKLTINNKKGLYTKLKMIRDVSLRLQFVPYPELLRLCSLHDLNLVFIGATDDPIVERGIQEYNGYVGVMQYSRVSDTQSAQQELMGKFSDYHDGKCPRYNQRIGGLTNIQFVDGFVYCIQGKRRNRPLHNISRAVRGAVGGSEVILFQPQPVRVYPPTMPLCAGPVRQSTPFMEWASDWYPVADFVEDRTSPLVIENRGCPYGSSVGYCCPN